VYESALYEGHSKKGKVSMLRGGKLEDGSGLENLRSRIDCLEGYSFGNAQRPLEESFCSMFFLTNRV
jgi:hypothetical protein